MAAELFHADERTDMAKINRFSQNFAKLPKNDLRLLRSGMPGRKLKY